MLKLVLATAATGLVAAALAVSGPLTARAASGPTGCELFGGPTPEQHFGDGHHSFTNSNDNCVVFEDPSNTAFLNDSNYNFILMGGVHNTVNDFNHSNVNSVYFDYGTSGNTLSASKANFNEVVFDPYDVADAVSLLGTTGDYVEITGSGLYADVEDPSSGGGHYCDVNAGDAGSGTASNPAIVIC